MTEQLEEAKTICFRALYEIRYRLGVVLKMNEPRECEVCLKEFDLDTEGFLNILEICEADDKVIEDYETENKINLQNYFCDDCTDKTLRQIEGKE
jgi:hypothetical protein